MDESLDNRVLQTYDGSYVSLFLNIFVFKVGMWKGYLFWVASYAVITLLVTNERYYAFTVKRLMNYIHSSLCKSDRKLFETSIDTKIEPVDYDTLRELANAWFSLWHAVISLIANAMIWISYGYNISDLYEDYLLPEYRPEAARLEGNTGWRDWQQSYDRSCPVWIEMSLSYLAIDLVCYLIPFRMIHQRSTDLSFASHHLAALFIWFWVNRFEFGIRSCHLIWIVTELGTIPLDLSKLTRDFIKFIGGIRFEVNDMELNRNGKVTNGEKEEAIVSVRDRVDVLVQKELLGVMKKMNSVWKLLFALEFLWARLYVVPLMTYYSVTGIYANPDELISSPGKIVTCVALGAGCGVGIYWTKRLITRAVKDLAEVFGKK